MPKFRFPTLDALLGNRQQPTEPPSRIIVGLGNPGEKYAGTRHNAGFWCVDRIAKENGIKFSRKNRSTLVGEGVIEGQRVVLAKPRTFVNRSGASVTYLLARFGAKPQQLLVIYDELNLPLGKLRLRPHGSAAGHNGVKSIIEALGTDDFPRLRFGIGRPDPQSDQIGFVIGQMEEDERQKANEMVERTAEAVSSLLNDGIDVAMNKFN